MKYAHCICCGYEFSKLNVFTVDGAKETQISGTCEKCFDELFAEEDDYDPWIDDQDLYGDDC